MAAANRRGDGDSRDGRPAPFNEQEVQLWPYYVGWVVCLYSQAAAFKSETLVSLLLLQVVPWVIVKGPQAWK